MFLRVLYSLALLLTAAALCGCAPLCCCTDRVGSMVGSHAVCDCGEPVCCDVKCCAAGSSTCSRCGFGACSCGICRGGGLCSLALRHHECRIEVGPPAVRHQPEMPPEFLPVPTRPITANVNMNAPTPVRGFVDAGWGRYFTVEGRN